MASSIRMKEGCPPDSELRMRIGASRTYLPNKGDYREGDEDAVGGSDEPTLLDCLLSDKSSIEKGELFIEELLDTPNGDEITCIFQIVDKDGTVWSEEYDEDLTEQE